MKSLRLNLSENQSLKNTEGIIFLMQKEQAELWKNPPLKDNFVSIGKFCSELSKEEYTTTDFLGRLTMINKSPKTRIEKKVPSKKLRFRTE